MARDLEERIEEWCYRPALASVPGSETWNHLWNKHIAYIHLKLRYLLPKCKIKPVFMPVLRLTILPYLLLYNGDAHTFQRLFLSPLFYLRNQSVLILTSLIYCLSSEIWPNRDGCSCTRYCLTVLVDPPDCGVAYYPVYKIILTVRIWYAYIHTEIQRIKGSYVISPARIMSFVLSSRTWSYISPQWCSHVIITI